MTPGSWRSALLKALAAVQKDSELPCPVITDDTIPLKDLPGFDSYSGVDVEVQLSETTGVEVTDLQFRGGKDLRPLTVREIVEALGERYGNGAGNDSR